MRCPGTGSHRFKWHWAVKLSGRRPLRSFSVLERRSRVSKRLLENFFRGLRSPSRSWILRRRSEVAVRLRKNEMHNAPETEQTYFHPAFGTIPTPTLIGTSRSAPTSISCCQLPFGPQTQLTH